MVRVWLVKSTPGSIGQATELGGLGMANSKSVIYNFLIYG